jgi:hypothetical protein
MIVQYYNQYSKTQEDWDTDKSGTYMTIAPDGTVLAMDETVSKCMARLAWYQAKRPDRTYATMFGPCAFSNRDVWMALDDLPSDAVIASARAHVARLSDHAWMADYNHSIYSRYKSKHGLSTQYM